MKSKNFIHKSAIVDKKVKLGSKQFDKFNYHQMHKKIINVYREELNKKNMIKFS